MNATRLELDDFADDTESPLQCELPKDPIETLQFVRAGLVEFDEVSGKDSCRDFDRVVKRYGREVAMEVGVSVADFGSQEDAARKLHELDKASPDGATVAQGGEQVMMALRDLRDSARCKPDEYRTNVKRLSLGHRRDVKLFIESRATVPAGTFAFLFEQPTRQEREARKVANWALGRK